MRNKKRSGAVTVEVALCLPVLLLLLFGCYELARANMILHAAQSAAYEGARSGIIPGATPQEVEQAAELVLGSLGISNFNVEISPSNITRETEALEVTVRVPAAGNLLFPRFFLDDPTFIGECRLSRELP